MTTVYPGQIGRDGKRYAIEDVDDAPAPDRPGVSQVGHTGEASSAVIASTRVAGDAFDRYLLLADGTILTGDGTYAPVPTYDTLDEWAVDSAVETISRLQVVSTAAALNASGRMNLTYFRARRKVTATQVTWCLGGVAAAATPTLSRIGLFTVADTGDLSLVASTANDTAMFMTTTFNSQSKVLQAPFTFVPGQKYASGILVVSASALPTFMGNYTGGLPYLSPRLTGGIAVADLPATIAAASVANANSFQHYLAFRS